jgi:hypothetical protein
MRPISAQQQPSLQPFVGNSSAASRRLLTVAGPRGCGGWCSTGTAASSLLRLPVAFLKLGVLAVLVLALPLWGFAVQVGRFGRSSGPVAGRVVPQRDGGVWLWRTNSTFNYAHMTMLASLPYGRLAAAWQAAPSHEGQALAGLGIVQALCFSLSRDSGRTWSEPSTLVRGMSPAWGPVLHFDEQSRKLWLFYSLSTVFDSPGGDVVYRTTNDIDSEAPVWSPPTVLWRSEDDEGLPKVGNSVAVAW